MVTTFFGAESFGGDAAYVDRLSRALLRRGHEVTVVHCADSFEACAGTSRRAPTSRPRGSDPHPAQPLAGACRRCGPTRRAGPAPRPPSCGELLDGGGFDVVHFHNISLIGGPGVIELAPAGATTVMTLHEHWLVCPTSLLWKFGREPCTQPALHGLHPARAPAAPAVAPRRPDRAGGRDARPRARPERAHRRGAPRARDRGADPGAALPRARRTGTGSAEPPAAAGPRTAPTSPPPGAWCRRRGSRRLVEAMRLGARGRSRARRRRPVRARPAPGRERPARTCAWRGSSTRRTSAGCSPERVPWWCRPCSSRRSATWWRRPPRWARRRSCTTAARRPS